MEGTVVTPTDENVATEIQSAEIVKAKQKASSGPSGVHIQEPRAKRYTSAAKARQDMNETMLAMLQKENDRSEIGKEDELDLAFAGIASRMRIHLNSDQKEDVIQEVEKVVINAINNVRKGMPVLAPINPGFRAPPPQQAMSYTPASTPSPAPNPRYIPMATPPPPPLQHSNNISGEVSTPQNQQQQQMTGGSGDFFMNQNYGGPTGYTYTEL